MAAIAERSHAATLTLRAALARSVSVTTPFRSLVAVGDEVREAGGHGMAEEAADSAGGRSRLFMRNSPDIPSMVVLAAVS